MAVIMAQMKCIPSLLMLQAREIWESNICKMAFWFSFPSNKLGYNLSVKEACPPNSECIIAFNKLRQSERRWKSVPPCLVYKVSTGFLKSECFHRAQGSVTVSWIQTPSKSTPTLLPPQQPQSWGCTSLWCCVGNWPEEIWGSNLTWVFIIRWVIVFLLLSTSFTRDASVLLWYGEIHWAKKKIFSQFYSGKLPSPMEGPFCILPHMFLSGSRSTSHFLAQQL